MLVFTFFSTLFLLLCWRLLLCFHFDGLLGKRKWTPKWLWSVTLYSKPTSYFPFHSTNILRFFSLLLSLHFRTRCAFSKLKLNENGRTKRSNWTVNDGGSWEITIFEVWDISIRFCCCCCFSVECFSIFW